MNRNPWNCLKVKRHQFENSAKSIWVEGKIKMKQLNMYLLTFLMFSLTAIAQGSNRLSEPDFKAANFAKAIEDRKLNGSVLRDFEVASEISCQFESLWRAMFILQLPSHPWQGDKYMPTKWLGPLYQWCEFYERGWSHLQRNTGDNTTLFLWSLPFGREFVKNSCFDELECHPARFKCISFGVKLLLSV